MFIVWVILGLVLLMPLASPFIFTDFQIKSISPECVSMRLYNKPCILCGMTRGFLEISRCNFDKATEFNAYSIWLYSTFLINELLLVTVVGCKAMKTINVRKSKKLSNSYGG